MKKLGFIKYVVFAALVLLFVTGCSEEDEVKVDYSGHPIIGTWNYQTQRTRFSTSFRENGNGYEIGMYSGGEGGGTTIDSHSFTYRIENNLLKCDFIIGTGTKTSHYMTFSKDFDTLFLGKEYELVRKQ
ncbi:MAG: hypothetical protein FWF51_13275 [Chitinivibrionia bacterium]|nr:hypothetical protein [Chitinivibrionia bacterium]